MKKIFYFFTILTLCFLGGIIFAQDTSAPLEAADGNDESVIKEDVSLSNPTSSKKIQLAGVSEVPLKKRPKTPDAEKSKKAALLDEGKDVENERKEILKFGTENEISDLIKKLIDTDDPRFTNEIYDLFEETKSPSVREKIISYFTKYEDPCIEDYAVTILNDPFDEKNTTVDLVFKYISAVKTKAAVPAVVTLLESDNENYFNAALSTLGEIGGEPEAEYLVSYLDRTDLSTSQRQTLMRVLGKLNATNTWERLCEVAQDENENSFVRMYAAESIGKMKKPESIPILIKLFENADANFRCYVIKGLSNYNTKEAFDVIVQGIRDSNVKVRLEAVDASEKMNIKDSVPYLIYRAKNDSESSVKNKAYEVLAKMNTAEGNEFLVEIVKNEKASDNSKNKVIEALLKYGSGGRSEIGALAKEIASDDRRKPLRYSIGKLMVKYPDNAFSEACKAYLASKDVATVATGLDMFKSARFSGIEPLVQEIAENKKAGVNQTKAKKILKIE